MNVMRRKNADFSEKTVPKGADTELCENKHNK